MNIPPFNRFLKIKLPALPEYEDDTLLLRSEDFLLELTLTEGRHVLSTPSVPVGFLKHKADQPLYANFSIWYEADFSNHSLTLCSGDLPSKDSVTLHLLTPDYGQVLAIQEIALNQEAEGICLGYSLNPQTRCTLQHLLTGYLQTVNACILNTIFSLTTTILLRTPPPDFSKDELRSYGLQSHIDHLAQNQNQSLPKIAMSNWGGTAWICAGQTFSNLPNPAEDRTIRGFRYRKLWEREFGSLTECCSFWHNGFRCSSILLGGLVTAADPKEQNITNIPTKYCYILPICLNHNRNDMFRISTQKRTNAVWFYQ